MIFENNPSGGILSLKDDNNEIGRLNYTVFQKENKLVITYVFVHSTYNGTGKGKDLVVEILAYAKENKWEVEAQCSFAKAVMMRLK